MDGSEASNRIITKYKYKEKNTSLWVLLQPKQTVVLKAYNSAKSSGKWFINHY